MSDANTEALRRQAAADNSPEGQARLLRARMRAGERVPGTAARLEGRQRCDACTTWGCTKCKTAGHVPDPSKTYTVPDLPISAPARVRAYSGDEVARLVAEVPSALGLATDLRSWWTVDRWDLAQWARGLLACVPEDAHLVGEGPCEAGCVEGMDPLPVRGGRTYCRSCDGTGRVSWRVSLRHHLAVTVGVAVGRACLPEWEAENQLPFIAEGHFGTGPRVPMYADGDRFVPYEVSPLPRRALDSAALWARCPCEEHARACASHLDYMPGMGAEAVRWWTYVVSLAGGASEEPAGYMLASQLTSASRLLSPDEVRMVASEAVLGWAGE